MPSTFADRQVVVFVSIAAAILILATSVFVFGLINPVLFALVLLAVAAIAAFAPRMMEFREYERGVLFRMGRLKGVVGPGWVWVLPYIDYVVKVDLRIQDISVPPQKVISKDGVAMVIDAVVNYKVKDPLVFATASKDIERILIPRIVSALREASASVDYLEAIAGDEVLDNALKAAVDEVAGTLGIEVAMAEIERIDLPKDLLEAMRQKESAIQKKDAVETEASIKQIYLERLDLAAKKLSPATLEYIYLDSLRRMPLSKADKIVIPYDFARILDIIAKAKPSA